MERAGKDRQVLLVDDEEKLLESIARRMKLLGFVPLTATSGAAAVEIARQRPVDLAIVDLRMPGMDGLATIAKLKELRPTLRTILLTGHGSEKIQQATESLNSVYFEKDEMGDFWSFVRALKADGKMAVIRPAAASRAAMEAADGRGSGYPAAEIEIYPDRPIGAGSEPGAEPGAARRPSGSVERPVIIGETPAMRDLRKNIERVGGLDCMVIIRGETGTGKELAARAIHAMSARRQHRFLAINCSYLGNEQMLGQLLGYRGGDLSEAILHQGGIFASDSGGTLLFENVADLPEELQVQLLKIIDSAETSWPHQREEETTQIRILFATDTDLMEHVNEGKFRKDLYFRLNLFELTIPPLRERKDDIAPLCSYFLKKYCDEFQKTIDGISQDVIDTFGTYDFPGNVRELEHIVERAVIIADSRRIEKRHLPARFQTMDGTPGRIDRRKFQTLAEVEIRYILEVLEATRGNKTQTAEILGISRAALWRKLKQIRADQKAG